MKNIFKYKFQAIVLMLVMSSLVFITACKDDEVTASKGVVLTTFGPSGLLAGDKLTFIGKSLDKVTTVVLPTNIEVTEFDVHTSTKIEFVLPEGVADGFITLKLSEGEDIVTKTKFGVGRPIEINSFSPATVKPGTELTLTGNFLNLVDAIVFVGVTDSVMEFTSQSKTSIKFTVPMSAKTGLVSAVYFPEEAWKDPQVIESDLALAVKLPVITSLAPSPIKPGGALTITGTDLDLATKIIFAGGTIVETAAFTSVTATKIVVAAPANIEAGELTLVAPSFEEVKSSSLPLVVSAITSATPMTIGLNDDLTISGTNLDLVTSVTFADGSTGTIGNKTASELVVKLTKTATSGAYTLHLASGNSIVGGALSIVLPTINSSGGIAPLSVTTIGGPETLTITGTRLEDIASAAFVGANGSTQWPADVTILSDTQLQIAVTRGSISGKVTLMTTNGLTVVSSESLTIVPDVPNVTTIPSSVIVGSMLVLEGTNLDVSADIWLPGSVLASRFGTKSSTKIEIYVAKTVPEGNGTVKFVTDKNEIYTTGSIFFKLPGVEPIKDGALIIDDFDEAGHGVGWDNWKGAFEEKIGGTGPGISDNGKYANGLDVTVNSWDWVLACNHDALFKQGPVSAANYVFKIDVFVTNPSETAVLVYRMPGGDLTLTNIVKTATPAWTTMTFELPGDINTAGGQTGEWGFAITGGSYNFAGFKVDNIRFSPK